MGQARQDRSGMAWPTPRAEDSEQTGPHGQATDTLTSAARQDWFTPTAQDCEQAGGPNRIMLTKQVRAAGPPDPASPSTTGKRRDWQTPAAFQGKKRRQAHQTERKELLLPGQAEAECQASGALNPAWVTQLMGFPEGWLDLPAETLSALSATPSSRKSPK